MDNIYVARDGQTFGPYTEAEASAYIAAGNLILGDIACLGGSSEWITLGELMGLSAPPPPMPGKAQNQTPVPVVIVPQKKKTQPITMLLAIVGIPLALLWGCFHIGSGVEDDGKAVRDAAQKQTDVAAHAEDAAVSSFPNSTATPVGNEYSKVLGNLSPDEKAKLGTVLSRAKTLMAEKVRKGIDEKKVVVGMSREDVVSFWGQPTNKVSVGNGSGEQWNYSGGAWAMFTADGMLFGFKDK